MMSSLTKKALDDDTSLHNSSFSLWDLKNEEPVIKQIFGHFLPPNHMKIAKGLVAKDFNFPSAYHASENGYDLDDLYEIGRKIDSNTIVCQDDSIKIRPEKHGAIAYTPYYNGFFINKSGYEIIKLCRNDIALKEINPKVENEMDTIIEFVARAITLELLHVCS